jgi:dihydropteroate synthase
MGVLNISPESFHAGSVHTAGDDLLRAALAMVDAGAALIDVGARSTAPYLETHISDAEECARLARAVEILARKLPVPVSADTARPGPARAALDAGAQVINDVSGLRDPDVARLVAERKVGAILMASPLGAGTELGAGRGPGDAVGVETTTRHASADRRRLGSTRARGVRRRAEGTGRFDPDRIPRSPTSPKPGLGGRGPISASGAPKSGSPVDVVKGLLVEGLGRAREAGVPEECVVLDPGIGFFRNEGIAWDEWDARVLAGLQALGALGRPLCVGVSRKSFIGAITGRPTTAERLAGSLAATTLAVWNGAALIRTHDVAETLDAVRVAERVREASGTL